MEGVIKFSFYAHLELLQRAILALFHLLCHCSEIHRIFDNVCIIGHLCRVYRRQEERIVVFPAPTLSQV